ncbi:lipoprotein-releasing ABC transporter ATP-binding protein LolD [uncultured Succinatimonas sp.]|uniref:lipoprotein-releasing ABC transporter ATP-binding protein LolD n=1 Tax=uncultured Succinatimonas sp. TaxID=1262973 RepID=UPI0025D7CB49|nr:lipoprotein-releasing ABC transporter ATP-binding protein LolD [uncultured Succinatimonas sp.]
MSEIILKVRNLTRTYVENKVSTAVLKGINLDIEAGKITAVTGKSGSGKSTLLHILGTLDKPTSGEIIFKGQDLTTLSNDAKAAFRNKNLGFIYQFHYLLGDFTALENVMLPSLIGGSSEKEAKEKALKILEQVGLKDRVDFHPGELSGGQRQRVAIARALCHDPDLILADEPTGNLDAANAASVFELFSSLVKEKKTTVIMVTHDETLATLCDRKVVIKDGVIEN